MLWLKMSGRAFITVSSASQFPWKSGRQHLDAAARHPFPKLADRLGEDSGAAVRQVVARHGCDDDVTQPDPPTASARRRGSSRSKPVGRPVVTEQKPQFRADLAQDQERGGAVLPALADVRHIASSQIVCSFCSRISVRLGVVRPLWEPDFEPGRTVATSAGAHAESGTVRGTIGRGSGVAMRCT